MTRSASIGEGNRQLISGLCKQKLGVKQDIIHVFRVTDIGFHITYGSSISRLHLLDTCSTLARLLIARSSSLYVTRIDLLRDYMCFALRGFYLIHPALSQNNWLQAEF